MDWRVLYPLSQPAAAPSCPVALRRVNMSSAVIVIQQRSKNGPRSDVDLTIWHCPCPGCSSTGSAFRGQLSPVQATHGCSVLCSCGDKKVGEATPNKWLQWQRIVLWCADSAWQDDCVTISLCDMMSVWQSDCVLLEWHPRLGWCQVQCHVTAPAILSPLSCCCPLWLRPPVNNNKFAGAQVLWCCGVLWWGELRNLICNEYDVMVGRRDLWSGYLFLWKVLDYFCAWLVLGVGVGVNKRKSKLFKTLWE